MPLCTRLDRPLGFQQVKVHIFQVNRHIKSVKTLALRTWRIYLPGIYSRYSFMSEAVSTPGSYCGRNYYVNEKFQLHHRQSNAQPYDM
jgi:hypothetical protein